MDFIFEIPIVKIIVLKLILILNFTYLCYVSVLKHNMSKIDIISDAFNDFSCMYAAAYLKYVRNLLHMTHMLMICYRCS